MCYLNQSEYKTCTINQTNNLSSLLGLGSFTWAKCYPILILILYELNEIIVTGFWTFQVQMPYQKYWSPYFYGFVMFDSLLWPMSKVKYFFSIVWFVFYRFFSKSTSAKLYQWDLTKQHFQLEISWTKHEKLRRRLESLCGLREFPFKIFIDW